MLAGVFFPLAMAIAIVLDPNGNAGGTGGGPAEGTPWRKRPFPPTRIAFWLGFVVGVPACLAAAAWWWLAR